MKVILGDGYESYQTALKTLGLESLEARRKQKCINFALKCLKHPCNQRLFPDSHNYNNHDMRTNEEFKVNFARQAHIKTQQYPIARDF